MMDQKLNRKRWVDNFTEDERRLLLGVIQDGMRYYQSYPVTLGRLQTICNELNSTFKPDHSDHGKRFAERFADMVSKRPATRRRRHCGVWTPPKPAKPILISMCDVSNPYTMTFYRCLWYRLGAANFSTFGVAPIGVCPPAKESVDVSLSLSR